MPCIHNVLSNDQDIFRQLTEIVRELFHDDILVLGFTNIVFTLSSLLTDTKQQSYV